MTTSICLALHNFQSFLRYVARSASGRPSGEGRTGGITPISQPIPTRWERKARIRPSNSEIWRLYLS